MRRALSVVVICVAFGATAVGCRSAATAETESQTGARTVTGKVIDLTCYYQDKANTGMNHDEASDRTTFACALACVRWEGQPAGVLTADGKVYQVAGGLAANSNVKIAPHLGHTVTIAGQVTEQDGMLMLASDEVTTATK